MGNTTIGDGMVAFAIAFAIVGFCFCLFYLLPSSIKNQTTDYELCIRGCPKKGFRDSFTNLKCPKMCAELRKEIINKNFTKNTNSIFKDTKSNLICEGFNCYMINSVYVEGYGTCYKEGEDIYCPV